MAPTKADEKDKEKKKKTSSSDKPPKDGKDPAAKKDKSSSKDAASGKDTKHKSSKDAADGSKSSAKDGKSKSRDPSKSSKKAPAADAAAAEEQSAGTARQRAAEMKLAKQREAERKQASSYVADMDLPSSEESEEEVDNKHRGGAGADDDVPLTQKIRVSDRELRKLNDKQRRLQETAARNKADALRDDDNVFDVSYESQGGAGDAGDTVSATDIKVHSLTVRVKGKVLLENTNVTIAAGRRYGLAGPNGMGKSTLLRLLARRQVPVPEGLDVLLVEQEVVGTEQSALQAVVAADVELMQLREEEAELTRRLGAVSLDEDAPNGASPAEAAAAPESTILPAAAEANGSARQQNGRHAATASDEDSENDDDDDDDDEDDDDDDRPAGGEADEELDDDEAAAAGERLNAVYERLQEMGSATAEARAAKILHGLGFSEAMRGRATSLFSGGWRMRISLARALYIQPTVLLLDEPTNHLDLRAVLWLEEYLMRWKKTLVVVSHDRDFLNNVTTDIVHLHDLGLHFYRGNFAQFEEMYEQKRTEVNKAAEKYEKAIKAAKRSGNKANQDKVAKNLKQTQQRKAGGKGGAAAAAAEQQNSAQPGAAPRRWQDYTVKFHFPEPTELVPPLIQLMDVSFQYPGRDDFGLQDLNSGVDMGSRVAIVGPNGAGKTTLMNLLAGDLEPSQGEFRKSHKLRIGRYAQHFVDALQMDETPVEYLLHRYPESGHKMEGMRSMLGRFGLSGHHHLQPIAKLSGGQKARVVFTSIALSQAHILLLDEPTNHLDMQSIDALAEALEAFPGGVIIISHDAQLLSRVCDETSEVWVVDDGRITNYNGYFEDYRDELHKEIAAELDEEERLAAERVAERAAAKAAKGGRK